MNHLEKIEKIRTIKQNLIINKNTLGLEGLNNESRIDTLSKQIFDSIRRVDYIYTICKKTYTGNGIQPSSGVFDPYKLISNLVKDHNLEEAYWLCFLITYCGKSKKHGWSSLKSIYIDKETIYDWEKVRSSPEMFLKWLDKIGPTIRTGFGNHRKYETFQQTEGKGPRAVFKSYFNLVKNNQGNLSQVDFFNECKNKYDSNPEPLFDALYKKEASKIVRFGRLSKFDYLTLLTKVGLIDLEPPEAYIGSSTGPKSGLTLLFLNNAKTSKPSKWHKDQMDKLKVLDIGPLKMQVLEDALCNWQKSPTQYTFFRG
ncbi:MAG: hypothetical protein JXR16_11725 [Bermanella sp.]